jgi:hypothetical protein
VSTPDRPVEIERDTDMTRTYVQVMLVEAAIIAGLWILGRIFS